MVMATMDSNAIIEVGMVVIVKNVIPCVDDMVKVECRAFLSQA